MFDIEIIPDSDMVYRQVHVLQTQKINNCRIPNEANFYADEDGLSVNWNKYIDVERIYRLLAISYNKTGKYIEYTAFKIFQFPVNFLRALEGVKALNHAPIYNDPEIKGKPNNQAHSLVVYSNDEQIRLELCDYVSNNYDTCYCQTDVKSLEIEIIELRNRLDGKI